MNPAPDEPLILDLDSPGATLERVGGKGTSLAHMVRAGLPVPDGFHLTTEAYHRFIAENHLADAILTAAAAASAADPSTFDHASAKIQSLIAQGAMPPDIAALILNSYAALGEGDPPIAVRSSATAEDLPAMSFAGQLETYLNVRGGVDLLDAVKRCWASLWTARALGYRARQGMRSDEAAIAIIVQEMAPADVAGVLFTANPLTGARDQIVINAAWGLGESIVGGSVTPDTYIVTKRNGTVESQTIADKAVMTVRQIKGTREEPVPAGKRRQASLQPNKVAKLAALGVGVEQLYGRPMDIEWTLSGERIFILQARPITTLPESCVSLDWTPPRAKGRYVRKAVVELLPDPLSPLFATLALPAWNASLRPIANRVAPTFSLPEHFMNLITINDYAYYDFSVTISQGVRLTLAFPRFIKRELIGWFRRAEERWAGEARPLYAETVGRWSAMDLKAMPAAELLKGAGELVRMAADYYLTIETGILPSAPLSDALFSAAYNRLMKRKEDPPALTFLLGFDSAPIRAEKSLYDLAAWARTQSKLAEYFALTSAADIAAAYARPQSLAPIADRDSWEEFCRRFAAHLDRFGHSVFDLDFSKSLAADEPSPLLETLKHLATEQSRSPYERQSTAAAARERATESLLARPKGIRRRLVVSLLKWAQRYSPLREDALADLGLGWPLVRRMLRELGRRFVAAGMIAAPDDVFWLKLEEAQSAAQALDVSPSAPNFQPIVLERRSRCERERRATPPVVLPPHIIRFMGIDFSPLSPARTNQTMGNIIKGQSASPGRVAGIARVIHGPDEFNQMRRGDILVAKITTPAWTPLFALAAAVVSDVGGPLSHSSIVAREYQIPAVLGTGVATERIRSGQRIIVDGDLGTVRIDG